jgi:hypothetical protein
MVNGQMHLCTELGLIINEVFHLPLPGTSTDFSTQSKILLDIYTEFIYALADRGAIKK